MTTTSRGLVTPDAGDDYALLQDLNTLAGTINTALEKGANLFHGTQTQRLNTTGLPDGTLWKDSTGERILWLRDNAQWVRIWPEPARNVFRVGSYDEVLGTVFYNMRRLYQDGTTTAASFELIGTPELTGMRISNWLNGSVSNYIDMRRNGEVGVYDGSNMRTLPFASAGGKVSIAPTGPNQITTAQISFPTGYFTQAPNVQLTAESAYPERVSLSLENVSTSGATIRMHRTDALSAVVHWSATQHREGSF